VGEVWLVLGEVYCLFMVLYVWLVDGLDGVVVRWYCWQCAREYYLCSL